ncbi:MAG: tRNA pseudouridine(55) synthase TruB [Candidatus Nomurabacteria bacterium]|jgi:tRNA pseudouridine55 synthase|nr:tRNA pseudouridine(55) synthase TruB [Candidatus Nomurabacteria bacterium]
MNLDRTILIDKPAHMTSFGVVARVRRRLTEAAGHKVKVGHTGTLDPFATGLLILLSGKMTKKSGEFLKFDKVYEAVVKLGETSLTGDPEGEITAVSAEIPSENALRAVLDGLVGVQHQKPPIYSAIKIDGQRAYKLARKGKIPEIPARKIEIYSIKLLIYSYPFVKIRVHVSSGTYIRVLAEEVGARLKTGAYCAELRRTKVGGYDVKDAIRIDDI